MKPVDRRSPGRGGPSRGLRIFRHLFLIVGCLWPCAASAAVVEITGDHRLIRNFIPDGGIVGEGWFELSLGYADVERGQDLGVGATAAFRFGGDVEAGLIFGALNRQRNAGDELFGARLPTDIDETGVSDLLLYGKYRFLRSPMQIAVGATATIPLADEDKGLGSGSPRFQIFTGFRKGFSGATAIWSIGVMRSADSEAPGRAEGETSLHVGAGLLVPLSRIWVFLVEANFSSGRYDGERNRSELAAGLDWRPTENTVIRGELGTGLNDAANDLTAVLSAAFHF